ncbi:tubulin-tyrosine ligase family-domain-containing protein [Dactylonectria estremocensis]|uniref:Tubulin-tyrosine ligase family-domain-containing protein n=1 Tax=Dactylonectria estremocensis TaxID=1079267 RepID=A0A9P9IQV2_9HYPO|nr:tubulin-tyrosine ligase family-domain-containing protein [Dactylonectria estremocensis]
MHVYAKGANPWLDDHVESFVRQHVPDAVFHDNIKTFPSQPDSVFQFCDGWDLNQHFAVLNKVEAGLINAYPNSDALARKDHLAQVVDYWVAKRPQSVLKEKVPATIRLSLDYAEYVDDALAAADDLTLLYSLEDNEAKDASEREWWILKPAMIDCGAGIRIFSTMEELASNLELAADIEESEDSENDAEQFTMMTPSDNSESDDGSDGFRPTLATPGLTSLDALITASGTLTLNGNSDKSATGDMAGYLFIDENSRIPSAQMREFVAQRYIISIPPVEGKKWHARAYVLSIGRLKVHVFREMLALLAAEDYEPPWKNPSLRSSLTNTALQGEDEFVSNQSMRDFWELPDDLLPNDWKNDIFRQACDISAELFQAAAHTMADKFTPLHKCFELFAVDFLVDTNGTAWLLEVNETPAFYQHGFAGSLAVRLMESVVSVAMEHLEVKNIEGTCQSEARLRMVEVLDETDKLGKSNITEIMPE